MDSATLYFTYDLLILISVSVFCGVVRYFHICDPYKSEADYYFPVRKLICSYYFSFLILVPCLIFPYSKDAILYGRAFVIGFFPVQSVCIISEYFKLNKRKLPEKIELWLDFLILLAMGVIALFDKDILISHEIYIIMIILCLYFFAIGHQIFSINKLTERSKRLKDTVSSLDDIPEIYKKIYIPLWLLSDATLLINCFTNSKWTLGSVFLFNTVINIALLIVILDPQRRLRFEIIPEEIASAKKGLDHIIEEKENEVKPERSGEVDGGRSENHLKEIAERLDKAMVEQELFKNPHLTINDVSDILGVHPLEIREAGHYTGTKNFFELVNKYRLNFASEYAKEHPDATKCDIAILSGFGSYRSFLRTKERHMKGQEKCDA